MEGRANGGGLLYQVAKGVDGVVIAVSEVVLILTWKGLRVGWIYTVFGIAIGLTGVIFWGRGLGDPWFWTIAAIAVIMIIRGVVLSLLRTSSDSEQPSS